LLAALWPVFISYVLSFIYVGIYWNNHHHMLHTVKHVTGSILWSNLHLLFWLSLFPFTTGWVGENHFAKWPMIVYGANLLMAAIAYTILQLRIVAEHGRESTLATAVGKDLKGKLSIVAYAFAIALAFLNPWISFSVYWAVALVWLIPDRRIERILAG
jgi:uncharacterized membrane protein